MLTTVLSLILLVLRDMIISSSLKFNHSPTTNTSPSLDLLMEPVVLVLLKLSMDVNSLDHADLHLLFAVTVSKKLVNNATWVSTSTPTGNPTDAEPTALSLFVVMVLLIVVRNVMMDNSTMDLTALVDAQPLVLSSQDTPTHMLPNHGTTTEPAHGHTNHLPGQLVLPTDQELNNHQSTSTPHGPASSDMDLLSTTCWEVTKTVPTRSLGLVVTSLLFSTTTSETTSLIMERPII